VQGEGGEVFVVRGRGGLGGPILEEHVPSSGSARLVGSAHEIRGGNICAGRVRGMQDEREASEAFLQG